MPRIKRVHLEYFYSPTRFIVVPAGRRSYKTEIAKRKLVLRSLASQIPDAWFVASAPTHAQAKRIFWGDLKRLYPPETIADIREAELTIQLVNGASTSVLGLDAPDRVEGSLLSGIVLDEYGKMKDSVWMENVRPALSNLGCEGWAIFIGVPEGRNHYYELYKDARADTTGEWATFHWHSSEVLEPQELEYARATMDARTFRQEFEASFEDFTGAAYYCFDPDVHAVDLLEHDPDQDLIFCFDFNWDPAVAVVAQEARDANETRVIDEIFQKRSNVYNVCEALIRAWKPKLAAAEDGRPERDPPAIYLYGDATGKAHRSGQLHPDWEIVRRKLRSAFGPRVRMRVPDANPRERERVNSVNCRLRSLAGDVHMRVSRHCKYMIRDLEGVQTAEDGSGDLLKETGSELTHLSDALGYYVHKKFPLGGGISLTTAM